jgi:hypothetical protein
MPVPKVRVPNTLSNISSSLLNGRPNCKDSHLTGQMGTWDAGRVAVKYLRCLGFPLRIQLLNILPDCYLAGQIVITGQLPDYAPFTRTSHRPWHAMNMRRGRGHSTVTVILFLYLGGNDRKQVGPFSGQFVINGQSYVIIISAKYRMPTVGLRETGELPYNCFLGQLANSW